MQEIIEQVQNKYQELYNGSSLTNDGDSTYFQSKMVEYNRFNQLPQYLREKLESQRVLPKESAIDRFKQHKNEVQKTGLFIEGNKSTDVTVYQPSTYAAAGIETDSLLQRHKEHLQQVPEWHAPWNLLRVINGHNGWVRCVAVDPENSWFATGSSDTNIKVWDLATGSLKLTLNNHVMGVRGLAISKRHPYMFSVSEDKTVKNWDLEKNSVIRDYYGHLSGVYSVDVHPTLDLVVTAGRDSVVRVWDMRTRNAVVTLQGHSSPITNVRCKSTDPQIISTSNDATVKLWDLVAGKAMKTLTHHKRSVRGLALHPTEHSFATCSTGEARGWQLPEGRLLQNMDAPDGIINTVAINEDNVMFSGSDDGTMSFYDWKTGHCFQDFTTPQMPGSLPGENGILASAFDVTGLRLITCEADKSIKVWKQESDATPETHPGNKWNPSLSSSRF